MCPGIGGRNARAALMGSGGRVGKKYHRRETRASKAIVKKTNPPEGGFVGTEGAGSGLWAREMDKTNLLVLKAMASVS
jgi:hypothetical protein